MVARVTSSSRYAQLIADMQMNKLNYEKLTAQLTSGHKIMKITEAQFSFSFQIPYKERISSRCKQQRHRK